MNFNIKYEASKAKVESNLLKFIECINYTKQNTVYESMAYSLEAGGKRFRPVLFMQIIELFGGNSDDYIDVACSLEYIHTYSLIHDDLPAMDNDEYRRGKKTNHMVFGEDIAILAGDALLNAAYEILFKKISKHPDKSVAAGAYEISQGAGAGGMIGGQVVDIQSEGKPIDFETLKYIHKKKTGALIEASVISAALFMEAKESELRALKAYSDNLGLAFQIADDILDYTGDFALLGKQTGSDEKNKKMTYVTFFGIEKSKELLDEAVKNAISSLEIFDSADSEFLISLARYVADRNR